MCIPRIWRRAADHVDKIRAMKAAGLVARPETLQNVLELEEYVRSDETITRAEAENPFGVPVAIRGTLLGPLEDLKKALPV